MAIWFTTYELVEATDLYGDCFDALLTIECQPGWLRRRLGAQVSRRRYRGSGKVWHSLTENDRRCSWWLERVLAKLWEYARHKGMIQNGPQNY